MNDLILDEKPYILCVDDEKAVLETLKQQIKQLDYDFDIAESGEEALEIFSELLEAGKHVAVVVSDQLMPGMKGDQLLINLHKQNPDTLKILLTGQAGSDAVSRAVNHANLYRYITKPWDKLDLLMTIDEAVKSYLRNHKIKQQNYILESIYNASKTISEEINVSELTPKLMSIAIDRAQADIGKLILFGGGAELMQLFTYAVISDGKNEVIAASSDKSLPKEVLDFVINEKKTLYEPNIPLSIWKNTEFAKQSPSQSLLCQTLVHNDKLIGIILLASYRANAFTPPIRQFMELLASNAAVSLDKAILYDNLDRLVKERTKEVVEQKALIEEKNKDITDSIFYARRIQTAILPSLTPFTELFPDSFVYYYPKDIVSGDFYWFSRKKDYFYFAAVDCTGHGVPGAMLSVLGCNLLNQIVLENELLTPSELLEILDKNIREQLKQAGNEHQANDGMDIALCRYHIASRNLLFAGAKRSLCIVRDGILTEYKSSRISIGDAAFVRNNGEPPFPNIEYAVSAGEVMFIFTDGFIDQFNDYVPPTKYSFKRFSNFLATESNISMDEMKNLLHKERLTWQGDTPQTDDILVIGLRFA